MKLAKNLELPLSAITSRICPLGMTGSGKTYTARRLVEQMLSAKGFTVIVDPKGDWFGLRAGKDGDPRSGYGVLIMGGEHGDVPLQPAGGKAVAEFLAAERVSTILDLSEWSESDMVRFVGDFGARFYTLNRKPVHLVVDEADEFAPQTGSGTQIKGPLSAALGACQRIQRRGRGRGIGTTFISQRSAVLSKSIISQAGIIIAHRTKHPRDIAPIEDWLMAAYGRDIARAAVEQLPGLPDGEAIVGGAPGTDAPIRIHVLPIQTFDSMRTPAPGESSREPKGLADVNVQALTARIAESIEQAKANDPAELRKRIAELERQARAKTVAAKSVVDQSAIDAAVEKRDAWWQAEWKRRVKQLRADVEKCRSHLSAASEAIAAGIGEIVDPAHAPPPRAAAVTPAPTHSVSQQRRLATQVPAARATTHESSGDITRPQKRILDALAWWASIGVDRPSAAQVGFVAGIKPTGGHFSNTVGPLSTSGLIERDGDGGMTLTPAGAALATCNAQSPTLEEYHDNIRRILRKGPMVKILNAIIAFNGKPISVDEIGEGTGINPSGGHFSNSIGPISTLGLVERSGGIVRPTRLLFPEGLA